MPVSELLAYLLLMIWLLHQSEFSFLLPTPSPAAAGVRDPSPAPTGPPASIAAATTAVVTIYPPAVPPVTIAAAPDTNLDIVDDTYVCAQNQANIASEQIGNSIQIPVD